MFVYQSLSFALSLVYSYCVNNYYFPYKDVLRTACTYVCVCVCGQINKICLFSLRVSTPGRDQPRHFIAASREQRVHLFLSREINISIDRDNRRSHRLSITLILLPRNHKINELPIARYADTHNSCSLSCANISKRREHVFNYNSTRLSIRDLA